MNIWEYILKVSFNVCFTVNKEYGINITIEKQWVRAFASEVEGWVFEYQSRQTQVVKIGSDSSTAKRSAICVSDTGPGWPLYKRLPSVTVGVAR